MRHEIVVIASAEGTKQSHTRIAWLALVSRQRLETKTLRLAMTVFIINYIQFLRLAILLA